jgi:hypothetical protein
MVMVMVLVVVMVMRGSERRAGKHHQKQCGGNDLLHRKNVTRERRQSYRNEKHVSKVATGKGPAPA